MTDPRTKLPAVNVLLDEAANNGLFDLAPRGIVVDAIRAVLDVARVQDAKQPEDGWAKAVLMEVQSRMRPSLRPVINATGVVLHTNLGRARLAEAAIDAVSQNTGPCTLEFNLETGERGSRQASVRELLREVTGAEDGLVVNNAAAGLLLALNTFADCGETIVSRGELVEIGGSFRIPEILRKSGSTLVEVGTTNRTRIKDYRLALSPRTRLLLKVHSSNFSTIGFTEDTGLDEIVALGQTRDIPTVHDVGSGLLVDLSDWGLSGEPLVRDSVSVGASVVFSGDKLLGGPQAGIIVGPSESIARASANPLARALRPDKQTLAALEATLGLYRDPQTAIAEIPTLAMLTADVQKLEVRATKLANSIAGSEIVEECSFVGGGSFPGVELAARAVKVPAQSPQKLLANLRQADPPVVARATDKAILLDVRTVTDNELQLLGDAVNEKRGN